MAQLNAARQSQATSFAINADDFFAEAAAIIVRAVIGEIRGKGHYTRAEQAGAPGTEKEGLLATRNLPNSKQAINAGEAPRTDQCRSDRPVSARERDCGDERRGAWIIRHQQPCAPARKCERGELDLHAHVCTRLH